MSGMCENCRGALSRSRIADDEQIPYPMRDARGIRTGELRPPRVGEWYLELVPDTDEVGIRESARCRRATDDMTEPREIVRLVSGQVALRSEPPEPGHTFVRGETYWLQDTHRVVGPDGEEKFRGTLQECVRLCEPQERESVEELDQ